MSGQGGEESNELLEPHTEACTPSPLFEPQTPPLLLQPRPTLADESFGPDALVVAVTAGLEAADVERSPAAAAASLGVKPKPNGEGRGVVERCLLRAGLEGGPAGVWPGTGREPMGPTEPMGPADGLEEP